MKSIHSIKKEVLDLTFHIAEQERHIDVLERMNTEKYSEDLVQNIKEANIQKDIYKLQMDLHTLKMEEYEKKIVKYFKEKSTKE